MANILPHNLIHHAKVEEEGAAILEGSGIFMEANTTKPAKSPETSSSEPSTDIVEVDVAAVLISAKRRSSKFFLF